MNAAMAESEFEGMELTLAEGAMFVDEVVLAVDLITRAAL